MHSRCCILCSARHKRQNDLVPALWEFEFVAFDSEASSHTVQRSLARSVTLMSKARQVLKNRHPPVVSWYTSSLDYWEPLIWLTWISDNLTQWGMNNGNFSLSPSASHCFQILKTSMFYQDLVMSFKCHLLERTMTFIYPMLWCFEIKAVGWNRLQ